MDAAASKIGDAEIKKLFEVYLKIENLSLKNQNKSVIKYTRIPDFDVTSRVSWPQKSYTLEPRFRRIIMVEEPKVETRRSLKSEIAIPSRIMSSDICKRKVVTIEEDDYGFHPKLTQNVRKTYTNMINRAVETDMNEEKLSSQRKISRLNNFSKSSKDTKINITNNKKEVIGTKLESKYTKYTKGVNEIRGDNKNIRCNESTRNHNKKTFPSSKFNLNEKLVSSKEIEKEISVTKKKHMVALQKNVPKRTISEKIKSNKSHSNLSILNTIKATKKAPVILVPLEGNVGREEVSTEMSPNIHNFIESKVTQVNKNTTDSSVQVTNETNFKDINIDGDSLPNTKDQVTEIDHDILKGYNSDNDKMRGKFDSLDIPNVSLMNNKSDIITEIPKEEIIQIVKSDDAFVTKPHATNPNRRSKITEKKVIESHYHQSTSYFISRSTLTCTTRQKIDFHVLGNDEVIKSHLSCSPCNYPMNVVSVFKQEMKNHHNDQEDDDISNKMQLLTDLTSINCSYGFGNDKLVKPSDIISTIKVNSSLLHRDYICEQFQRELNFIDSFFESLQYLENCSLSEKGITEKKVENFMNSSRQKLNNIEYGSFLSKFEDDVNVDDTTTMASKSLCLLNLLIRDEQRRAKNLLFVLKMREDALKDFTKSQILWLENKKKQDNIDISTLKKKQRGALLKLQHECGEMQRMRKALLTLSEKRKLAFMKTKKNIELKLKNTLDVEQIIIGKKKLRRNTTVDRNVAPVKCFELSSSGCEDSTTTRPKSTPILLGSMHVSKGIKSVEKCVQTNDSLCTAGQVDQSTNTADENFVVVDGGYLNILFHNVSLPQIFSSGKQYEVNQEALKNIVQTSNIHHFNLNNDSIIEELMDQIKDLDRSSTPSTARSLLDEFDQIYKSLAEEDKSPYSGSELKSLEDSIDTKDVIAQINLLREEGDKTKECDHNLDESDYRSSDYQTTDESCTCEPSMVSVGTQVSKGKEVVSISVSGPLPIPAGAAAVTDDGTDVPTWLTQTTLSVQDENNKHSSSHASNPSISSLTSPVHFEAEELRRQQLAIEREIKALEQQQCQLLAVREIPDKPPPPYTPPSEPKTPKKPRNFHVDEIAQQKIRQLISDPNLKLTDSDPFDIFVTDFCQDAIQRHNIEKNEKYWDTCNFLPQKTALDSDKFINKTVLDIKEVLTSVPPTIVSGVGARRSDHIDDILFAEWRRCEPEWTSLHADDVIVKNQVFESIFQKILTETIDIYKKTVITPKRTTNK